MSQIIEQETIPPPASPQASEDPTPNRRLQVSMTLENTGSVARDHLASERTFLAYVRTSLAIASTGVALVQLFTIASNSTANDAHLARPLGATMVCLGMVVLAIGTTRYFRIQNALVVGMYPIARLTSAFITLVLGAVIIVVFAVMLNR